MQIPNGYRLAVVNPEGAILDTIDLEGYDLTKPMAAVTVADEVAAVLRRDGVTEGESDHLGVDRSEDELFRHLDIDHGIDPNTIDDGDPEAIHEREHGGK